MVETCVLELTIQLDKRQSKERIDILGTGRIQGPLARGKQA